MFAVDDNVSPGWPAVRYTVNIESPADEARVMDLIEHADRYSPLLDDFKRPLKVERVVRIAQSVKE
jgi:hypothetical protein